MPNIVVLGAGVSGLTCALLLAKEKDNVVTVVAKHMPGDYDIEYTSPWAACPLSETPAGNAAPGPSFANSPPTPIAARVLRRSKDIASGLKAALSDGLFQPSPWYKEVMDNFRELPASELPAGMHSGCEFTSVCINTAIYLPWLVGQCAKLGVQFKRAVLKHVSEAVGMSHSGQKADVVINASGLLSCRLGGVMDGKVYPARGQIVLVRNGAEDHADDERV
ncbi:D-amino acid oxidase [Collariella sp. IMI 366227]|nr:D-amino acid oxidase [Collariella sp. IMI 366227]